MNLYCNKMGACKYFFLIYIPKNHYQYNIRIFNMIRVLVLSLAIILMATPSFAQTFKGEFNDWALFTTTEGDTKVCYITSNPTRKTGNYRVRGDVYMLVTYRGPLSKPEVSIDTGFPYRKGSEVDFSIDGRKNFKFFTSAQTPQMAWAKDEQMDRTVIDAMKRGGRVTTKGTSQRGTYAQDTYSLKGFTAAYDKMVATCRQ